MTSDERADALVYGTNLLRMTNEAEASRAIAEAIDAAVEEATNARDHEIASLTREVERFRAIRDAEVVAQKTTLKGLVGHKVGFCGVDNHTIVLRAGGKLRAFEVRENEEDGYRSSLDEVREVPLADTIHFRESVADVMVGKVEWLGDFVGYTLVDDSGHTWLRAGTDYREDYYPCFTFDYTPPERPVVAEALPRWVPVGERLPRDEVVLVCTEEGMIFMAEWRERDTERGGRWLTDSGYGLSRVTAWQQLPAAWVAP